MCLKKKQTFLGGWGVVTQRTWLWKGKKMPALSHRRQIYDRVLKPQGRHEDRPTHGTAPTVNTAGRPLRPPHTGRWSSPLNGPCSLPRARPGSQDAWLAVHGPSTALGGRALQDKQGRSRLRRRRQAGGPAAQMVRATPGFTGCPSISPPPATRPREIAGFLPRPPRPPFP